MAVMLLSPFLRGFMKKKNVIRKRKEQFTVYAIVALFAILLLAIGWLVWNFAIYNRQNEVLKGTYAFNDDIQYSFDGRRYGKLILVDEGNREEYSFRYDIRENDLYLNFSNQEIESCRLYFWFEEENLIIVGEEGTTGGAYSLYPVK